MTDMFGYILYHWKTCVLFLLLVFLASKVNLKKIDRSRQLLFVPIAFIGLFTAGFFAVRMNIALYNFFDALAERMIESSNGRMQVMGNTLARELFGEFSYLLFVLENAGILFVFLLFKRIIITVLYALSFSLSDIHEAIASILYVKNEDDKKWYLQESKVQARTFMKINFWVFVVACIFISIASCYLYEELELAAPFFPVCAILFAGELYFAIDGQEYSSTEAGNVADKSAARPGDFSKMKAYLKRLFEDHLGASATTFSSNVEPDGTAKDAISLLKQERNPRLDTYGSFMEKLLNDGFEIDQGYLNAGKQLLEGKSIVFHNPFYYDLIPYIFYPMHHFLIEHGKILVVLGRHGTEQEMTKWLVEGLQKVSGTSSLWRIGILNHEEEIDDLDVAIMTRSMVYDLKTHEARKNYLSNVRMTIIVEPSRLLGSAQMGLQTVVQSIQANESAEKHKVFCALDRNCDGLVDTLSHVLMTELITVSATNHHSGASTYMVWEADSEHLQHRMLPNLSRYMGFGTELSFAALKNRIQKASWYGGDAFPVLDAHWISNQYYYELLRFAELPGSQDVFNDRFRASAGMWNASVEDYNYMTVEDENYNMFEIRRNFATRARKEGFVNIISPEYLLRDYMADNDALFEADAKAIPSIVPDYVRTGRNVALRLCLRMSIGKVWEEDIRREFKRVNIPCDNPGETLWRVLFRAFCSVSEYESKKHYELPDIIVGSGAEEKKWTFDVFHKRKQFNTATGRMEVAWFIADKHFIDAITHGLENVHYLSEDDAGHRVHLGTELRGQLFQKYLPGQYMTLAGKNYEVVHTTKDGHLLLQRAADHISGRPMYKQVRNYSFTGVVRSDAMGDRRHTGGLQTEILITDMTVSTPAYWVLNRGSDFEHGHRVEINAIPDRNYKRKRILKLSFANGKTAITPNIRATLALLMNEVIRTMFAEHAAYLAVVTEESLGAPMTYHMSTQDCEMDKNSIYVIEDSQMDLGLLEAVRRNLSRIFAVCCDYLEWHKKTLDESIAEMTADENVENVDPEENDAVTEESAVGVTETAEEDADKVSGNTILMDEASIQASDLEFEADGSKKASDVTDFARKPYRSRYYLLFGAEEQPEWIDVEGTIDFLESRDYGRGELKQARDGRETAQMIADGSNEKFGAHRCDFCGRVLHDKNYDRLKDGRERCSNCSKTVIKTEREFADIYKQTISDMERFFDIQINVPVSVKMVNAKRLHKAMGKTFIPSSGTDSRVVGIAIKSKGGYVIMVENGSPREKSILTFVHELTHIWQYVNWDAEKIKSRYGNAEIEIYEGMAKWAEIQYAYLLGEHELAAGEEFMTICRDDEYGRGYKRYLDQYSMTRNIYQEGDMPFNHVDEPIHK